MTKCWCDVTLICWSVWSYVIGHYLPEDGGENFAHFKECGSELLQNIQIRAEITEIAHGLETIVHLVGSPSGVLVPYWIAPTGAFHLLAKARNGSNLFNIPKYQNEPSHNHTNRWCDVVLRNTSRRIHLWQWACHASSVEPPNGCHHRWQSSHVTCSCVCTHDKQCFPAM